MALSAKEKMRRYRELHKDEIKARERARWAKRVQTGKVRLIKDLSSQEQKAKRKKWKEAKKSFKTFHTRAGVHMEQKKILIGCTGSVAAIKLPILISTLKNLDTKLEIRVVTTKNATHFFDMDQVREMATVMTDEDEWLTWTRIGDPVLHIDLRQWADMLVIAPLDANTLAKMACGICDNLLTCVARAWDAAKPLVFCPAMNTHMWDHPITRESIDKLKSFNYIEVPCISKKLACGDDGLGAMAEVETIVETICTHLDLR